MQPTSEDPRREVPAHMDKVVDYATDANSRALSVEMRLDSPPERLDLGTLICEQARQKIEEAVNQRNRQAVQGQNTWCKGGSTTSQAPATTCNGGDRGPRTLDHDVRRAFHGRDPVAHGVLWTKRGPEVEKARRGCGTATCCTGPNTTCCGASRAGGGVNTTCEGLSATR